MASEKRRATAPGNPVRGGLGTLGGGVFRPDLWMPLVVAMAGFVLYANTIAHGYVLDDEGAITGNPFVLEGLRGIPKIFSAGMWHFEQLDLGYYRPLPLVTFAIENEFFPGNPHVSHFGNVLLYALTGFFLCRLLMDVLPERGPALPFVIALLFMAHPVHTEVVANIKSRDEILAFLNLIVGMWFLLKAGRGTGIVRGRLMASCFFFYLALLSKESAIIGLLFMPLVVYFSSDRGLRHVLSWSVPFGTMVAIFLLHKYLVLGSISGVAPQDMVTYPYAAADARIPAIFMIQIGRAHV